MFKPISILILAVALSGTAALADNSSRVIVGGALGGAAGSAIGYELDGRDGAIVGAALGGAVGAAVAHRSDRREVVVHRTEYRKVYPVRYYDEPRVVYRPVQQVVYVPVERHRGHGKHWKHHRRHGHGHHHGHHGR
ncbi:MAG: glycine zipper 2TM domain-containing protein [Chitinimonas sp.]|nr:glycine zipper 2TM domain-containing protein [Chitinimonas sp.]